MDYDPDPGPFKNREKNSYIFYDTFEWLAEDCKPEGLVLPFGQKKNVGNWRLTNVQITNGLVADNSFVLTGVRFVSDTPERLVGFRIFVGEKPKIMLLNEACEQWWTLPSPLLIYPARSEIEVSFFDDMAGGGRLYLSGYQVRLQA